MKVFKATTLHKTEAKLRQILICKASEINVLTLTQTKSFISFNARSEKTQPQPTRKQNLSTEYIVLSNHCKKSKLLKQITWNVLLLLAVRNKKQNNWCYLK